jgi:hypothetical protein
VRLISDITKKPGFWDVDGHRIKVDPFPGKWPTRWRIAVRQHLLAKAEFDLTTKPDLRVIQRILSRAKSPGQLYLYEFDKGGAFRFSSVHLPSLAFRVNGYAAAACYFYYPFHPFAEDFFRPWLAKLYRIKLGRRPSFVFSPLEEMAVERIREYETWLKKTKPIERIELDKLPPPPKPATIEQFCPHCECFFKRNARYKGQYVYCNHCDYRQRLIG